jgi:hypothetical protein
VALRIAQGRKRECGEVHIGRDPKDDRLSRKRHRHVAEGGKRASNATRLLIFVPGRSGLTIRGLVSAIVANGEAGIGRVADIEIAQGEADEQQLQRHRIGRRGGEP